MSEQILKFEGSECCIFSNELTAKQKLIKMVIIKRYGDTFYNADKSVKHYLHTWDDGGRYLIQCPQCGAYFLVQKSEFHSSEDSYYTDWFQVESIQYAEMINEELSGFDIEMEYDAPTFFETNGNFHRR